MIEWFPDDHDDPENPTTRNPEITIGSRHFWVRLSSTQAVRNSRWWRNFFIIKLFDKTMHQIMIGVLFLCIDLSWWRRDWMGWLMHDEKALRLYDAEGEWHETKLIPYARPRR